MPFIVPIIEGDGDLQAVPILLRRILQEQLGIYDWQVKTPKKAHSLPVLTSKLEQYLHYCLSEPQCSAILILLDLDDGCPAQAAQELTRRIRALHVTCPVAVVLAHREYEAWFLASLESLGGHAGLPLNLTYPGDVERLRGVKEWLGRQMPPGRAYKETIDQAALTATMDLERAAQRSRSFRRLVNAVQQVVRHAPGAPPLPFVTP